MTRRGIISYMLQNRIICQAKNYTLFSQGLKYDPSAASR
jgi:hypothetical protein